AEVLDQDIRLVAQREKAMPALGIVEVDRGATLVGVAEEKGQGAIGSGPVVHEGRTEAARFAAGRLDLDHVGAEIGEEAARKRTAQIGELDHANVGERPGALHRVATSNPRSGSRDRSDTG